MSITKQGYFLIADITGYTMYLSQSELAHAQETLQSLLELLIEHTKPPLIISRLAGDAVISYGLQDNFFSGQTFVELIEDTYVSFRKAVELMVLNNTCQCNACANVGSLDLKFFVHYGEFGIQRLSEHDELVGNDVNLIHRLLKNRVTAETGVQAYTLYTEAAIGRLGLENVAAKTMISHVETYEHLGPANTWIQDMHPVWKAKKDQAQIRIAPDDVLVYEEGEFPLSPYVMWDIVTDPEYRAIFMRSTQQQILNRQGGRLAPGSIYQCFHGKNRVTLQTILEWQPFEQMTTEDSLPGRATALINIKLDPIASGTRLSFTISKARGPWISRILANYLGRSMVRAQFHNGIRELKERVEKEITAGKFEVAEPLARSLEQVVQPDSEV